VRIALILRTRRFSWDAAACERRIFAERFETAEPRARRTSRLDDAVPCLAIALGGGPVASLSRRLNVEVSNDTLLRMVRRRGSRRCPPPTIVGIDDWAWRRNHRRPWLEHQLAPVSGKSGIADELRYSLNPWEGLVRFLDDGRIELDTNIVERAIRPIVLNRKNALFAGH
jgi:Transposase IS66 family